MEIQESPDAETENFTDKQQEQGPEWLGLVKAQSERYDVSYDRHPADERYPYAVTVDVLLLFLEGLALDFEVLFEPLPFTGAPQEIGGYAAEPVAQGTYYEANPRLFCGHQHGYV